MARSAHPASLLVAASLLLVAGPAARGFGPGVHGREAARMMELLAAGDASWAELMETTPLAGSHLHLGAISPDFEYMTSSLPALHGKALSYHLLDAAADQPAGFRLFALGHLAHNASDASSEGFVTPTLFAGAPVGVFDLFAGQAPHKESEGIVEAFGDLLLGDWHSVVDVLFDVWVDGPEAQARLAEIFGWYCETSAAHLGKAVDCATAYAELGDMLGMAEGILGLMDREEAKEFVDDLLALPLHGEEALCPSAVEGAPDAAPDAVADAPVEPSPDAAVMTEVGPSPDAAIGVDGPQESLDGGAPAPAEQREMRRWFGGCTGGAGPSGSLAWLLAAALSWAACRRRR